MIATTRRGRRGGAGDLAAVRIETARLRLRPPEPGDLDALVAAINHWEVVRWLARVPHPYLRSDGAAYLARVRGDVAAGIDLPLHVFDDAGLAGCVGLRGIGGPAPELGYWLAPDRWGRGYATEATAAVLDLAFGRLGASEIASGVFAGNDASLAVQRRLGFAIVGSSRVFCLARGEELDHIDTLLTRARHEAEEQ